MNRSAVLASLGSVAGLTADEARRLEAVLDEYLVRLERGERPDGAQIIMSHPDLAAALEANLATLDALQQAALDLKADQDWLECLTLAALPEQCRLGDFQLVRPLGRGGMGVVYEARQISLDRPVALKLLPLAAVLEPRQLERFKIEARVAASLHHPNIVPIHAVGCERGVHYYAMHLVDGETLAAVIDGLREANDACSVHKNDIQSSSSPVADRMPAPEADTAGLSAALTESTTNPQRLVRTIAKLGIQAAEALDYAHANGVVHRDIKPSNLLLDSRGNLWITDFGLARMGVSANMTMTGDLVGTLRYMSPEQAIGRRLLVDHRTDIYSLGATLYELFSLQPAFPGDDRQQVLRDITDREPAPLRRINPTIPVDMETIVHKAMSKRAEDRYATAQDLANDLNSFLHDRPIQARKPSIAQRVSRWSRRHRAVVWSAAAVLLVATGIFGLSTFLVTRAYQREATQRTVAESNERLANESYETVRRLVDDMITKTAERLRSVPKAQEIRREVLMSAVKVYDAFIKKQESDPAMQFEIAKAWRHVGEINRNLAKYTESREAYHAAITVLERLQRKSPAAQEYRAELARAYVELSQVDTLSAAQTDLLKAALLATDLRREAPALREYEYLLARIHDCTARHLTYVDKWAEAEQSRLEALAIWDRLAGGPSVHPLDLIAKAHCHAEYGHLLQISYRLPEAVAHLREAASVRQKLAFISPFAGETDRAKLADATGEMAMALSIMGDHAAADAWFREAIDATERLTDDFTNVGSTESLLGYRLRDHAVNLIALDRLDEAEAALLRSRQIARKLLDDYPEHVLCDLELGSVEYFLGGLYFAQGRHDAAKGCFRRAGVLFERHAEICAESPRSARRLVIFLATCPDSEFCRPANAISHARRMVESGPENGRWWHLLGIAQCQAGQWKSAAASLKTSIERRSGGDAFDRLFLARAHWNLGDKEEALRWHRQAVDYIEVRKRVLSKDFTPLDLARLRKETEEELGVEKSARK